MSINRFEVPLDMFDYFEIDRHHHDISRPRWRNALARLREMKRCPQAFARVKTLKVNIYVYTHEVLRLVSQNA
jgi:hypothetical protein